MSTQRYSDDLRSLSSSSGTSVISTKYALRANRPPNPLEVEAIQGLIEEDNQFVALLEQQLDLRKQAESDAVAHVAVLETECSEAEERLRTAQDLHNFFVQTRSKLPALRPNPSSPPSTPVKRLSVRSFDTLLKLTSSYTDSTTAALEGSAVALEEAKKAMIMCQENHQTALTVAHLRHTDVEVLAKQIRVVRQASVRKKEIFRTIWRMPEEVWRQIFMEVVQGDTMMEFFDFKSKSTEHWSGGLSALLLSLVCHNWRVIAHSTPFLWSNIGIPDPLHSQDVARIRHYYTLAHKPTLCIRIFGLTGSEKTTRLYQSLQNVFDCSIPAKALKLYVRSPACASLKQLLPYLPPPHELHINRPTSSPIYSTPSSPRRSIEVERTPTPFIPAAHCASVQVLHISAGGAEWEDETSLHLRKYTIVAPPPSAIFGPHRFLPSSMDTLKVVGIEGRLVDTQPPRSEERKVLPNVEEVMMDLDFLANVFSLHYKLQRLKKITISRSSTLTNSQWEKFQVQLHKDRVDGVVEEVEVYSMTADFESTVLCLTKLPAVHTLILHEDSVDGVLHMLTQKMKPKSKVFHSGRSSPNTEACLLSLKKLVIERYKGDGVAIAEFVEERLKIQGEALKVDLGGYTRIGLETRLRIKEKVALV